MDLELSPSGRKRPTGADVARLAGVSVGTVSKALSGRGNMRDDTRLRIRQAAETLGFVPNALAKGLMGGRSFTVGLISTESFGRFSGPVALGAEQTLGSGDFSVFLCDGRGDPVREAHYIRRLLARQVDGIIVSGRRHESRPLIARGLPIPVVYALSPCDDPNEVSLIVDDAQGAALAIQHLVQGGRRHIGHITGPQHHLSARLRSESAERVLAGFGLSFAGGGSFAGGWSESWGREAAQILLATDRRTDAIFCGSDQIARGAAETIRSAGLDIPGDIALVGFDNWDVMVAGSVPPLTSVDMNFEALGRTAATALLDAIEGKPWHGTEHLPCRIVVRESSGAMARRAQ